MEGNEGKFTREFFVSNGSQGGKKAAAMLTAEERSIRASKAVTVRHQRERERKLWLQYWVDGRQIRESAETEDPKIAREKLRKRLERRKAGQR